MSRQAACQRERSRSMPDVPTQRAFNMTFVVSGCSSYALQGHDRAATAVLTAQHDDWMRAVDTAPATWANLRIYLRCRASPPIVKQRRCAPCCLMLAGLAAADNFAVCFELQRRSQDLSMTKVDASALSRP